MDDPNVAARMRLNRSVTAWIAHRGLNPTGIHKATGVSRDVVYRLTNLPKEDDETDRKWLPALGSLVRLGALLKVEPSDLLAGKLPPADGGPMLPVSDAGTESRLTDHGSLATAHDSIAATQESLAIVLEVLRDNLQALPAPAAEQLRHASELLRPAS